MRRYSARVVAGWFLAVVDRSAGDALTHREDPWLLARGDLPPEARSAAVIPKEHMKSFYRALYERLGE